MNTNGQFVEPRIKEIPSPIAPTPGRLLGLMYLQLAILLLLVLTVLFEAFVVVPGYKQIADTINAQREADSKHMRRIEDARKTQIGWEVELLLQQQQNLKLAKELNTILKGD
jgi:hypothetical protein